MFEAEARPSRRRLPKKRPSQTISFAVAGAEGYLTAGSYPDDGLGEVFIKMSKQGSTLAGVMDAFSVAISIGLQYGVPLEAFVTKFTNMRFDPAGMTDDPDVRFAQSVMDYIFRRLALDYLPYSDRAALGFSPRRSGSASSTGHPPGKRSMSKACVLRRRSRLTREPAGKRPARACGDDTSGDGRGHATDRPGRSVVFHLWSQNAQSRQLLRVRILRLDERV